MSTPHPLLKLLPTSLLPMGLSSGSCMPLVFSGHSLALCSWGSPHQAQCPSHLFLPTGMGHATGTQHALLDWGDRILMRSPWLAVLPLVCPDMSLFLEAKTVTGSKQTAKLLVETYNHREHEYHVSEACLLVPPPGTSHHA